MMTKRNFLKTLAAGYSAGALGYPSNETIQIGCIGTGGRAQMLMKNLESIPGARIAAVCDVWDDNLAKARQLRPVSLLHVNVFAVEHSAVVFGREG